MWRSLQIFFVEGREANRVFAGLRPRQALACANFSAKEVVDILLPIVERSCVFHFSFKARKSRHWDDCLPGSPTSVALPRNCRRTPLGGPGAQSCRSASTTVLSHVQTSMGENGNSAVLLCSTLNR